MTSAALIAETEVAILSGRVLHAVDGEGVAYTIGPDRKATGEVGVAIHSYGFGSCSTDDCFWSALHAARVWVRVTVGKRAAAAALAALEEKVRHDS